MPLTKQVVAKQPHTYIALLPQLGNVWSSDHSLFIIPLRLGELRLIFLLHCSQTASPWSQSVSSKHLFAMPWLFETKFTKITFKWFYAFFLENKTLCRVFREFPLTWPLLCKKYFLCETQVIFVWNLRIKNVVVKESLLWNHTPIFHPSPTVLQDFCSIQMSMLRWCEYSVDFKALNGSVNETANIKSKLGTSCSQLHVEPFSSQGTEALNRSKWVLSPKRLHGKFGPYKSVF